MLERDNPGLFETLTELGVPSATNARSLNQLFGAAEGLLPLWISEPYVPLAPEIVDAIRQRAAEGWFGYEARPMSPDASFWNWMERRHGWTGSNLWTTPSHSVGTSIGSLIDMYTSEGDGIILQPPVFTDFKPLISRSRRTPVRNSLSLVEGRYQMDLEHLESVAAEPQTRLMILCNPHNPVGRAWALEDLREVAAICARHEVFVVADEIHADLMLSESSFVPFSDASGGLDVRTAAIHGPIKTFGLAGVADTLLVADEETTSRFREMSRRLHLNRTNVFSLAATKVGYTAGDAWLDSLLELVSANASLLETTLPTGIRMIRAEATYLAWLDFRKLGMDVPELSDWLVSEARLALSPGHWFGREGAGFARMTIAAPTEVIEDAVTRLAGAVERL